MGGIKRCKGGRVGEEEEEEKEGERKGEEIEVAQPQSPHLGG